MRYLTSLLMALTLLLLLAISLTGFAQIPDTLWSRTYGESSTDYIDAVIQTADGGFIMAGQANYENQFTTGDLWLLRTNANGDTLWSKIYATAGIDRGRDVLQTADGGFMIAGYQTTPDGLDRDAWLLRTNAVGDTLWSKVWGGSSSDELRSLGETPDGGFILAGTTRSFGNSGLEGWLIRTNANGDTLWTRTYGGPATDILNRVIPTADGGFVAIGQQFDATSGAYDLWLVRGSANGDTLWTKAYNGPHFSYSSDYGSDIRATSDGGFFASGKATGLPNTTNSDAWLLRLNASGDTLWTRLYGGISLEETAALEITPDGGVLMTGYTFAAGVDIDAFIMRTDANGDSLWTIPFGGTGNDQITDIHRTSDGGYIASGFTSSPDNLDYNGWLIRLAGDNATGIGENPTPNPQGFQLFQNYPNPFNPSTQIEFDIAAPGWTELNIFDIAGRAVRSLHAGVLTPGHYNLQWDGKDDAGRPVSSGVYFYQFSSGPFSLAKKMMLIR
ncbi:MAG TPA: FlgD immunoglobulin-like domain containing protein [Calditrichia bacterium]|nr:T9SS type A sorting domain-containing protein [Calditrichota bacterium]HQV31422.1 FlgD immunoglobulin-like domain containing protein [Calditrichia bacterium]